MIQEFTLHTIKWKGKQKSKHKQFIYNRVPPQDILLQLCMQQGLWKERADMSFDLGPLHDI